MHHISDGQKHISCRLFADRVVIRALELRAKREQGQFFDVPQSDRWRKLLDEISKCISEQADELGKIGCVAVRKETPHLHGLETGEASFARVEGLLRCP